jgi:GDP-4-dehydro-6-deoxy-D-mannose reductase
MKHKILVTGARGFVGGHLLHRIGERALAADIDVTDAEAVTEQVRAAQPGAVVHLAARSSVASSWERQADLWNVNVVGTVNVLVALAREQPQARLLLASTADVYGPDAPKPTSEDADPAPLSPYAASKLAAEIACERAQRVDGLNLVIARSFPHIGPGQGEEFAIGSWTAQVARLEAEGGGALHVGDLSVERDLTDVRDVVRAYELLLEDSVPAGVYNIASGTAVPLTDVVGLLTELATCPITVEPDPTRLRSSDIRVLCGDASRVRETTGWEPKISLRQALADALSGAREAQKAQSFRRT